MKSSPTLSKQKGKPLSKMSKDDEKTTSIKEIPFYGKREKYKEWESRMFTLAEGQGWRGHLEKEINTITWEQYEIGFMDLDPKDSYDVSNCKVKVTRL